MCMTNEETGFLSCNGSIASSSSSSSPLRGRSARSPESTVIGKRMSFWRTWWVYFSSKIKDSRAEENQEKIPTEIITYIEVAPWNQHNDPVLDDVVSIPVKNHRGGGGKSPDDLDRGINVHSPRRYHRDNSPNHHQKKGSPPRDGRIRKVYQIVYCDTLNPECNKSIVRKSLDTMSSFSQNMHNLIFIKNRRRKQHHKYLSNI